MITKHGEVVKDVTGLIRKNTEYALLWHGRFIYMKKRPAFAVIYRPHHHCVRASGSWTRDMLKQIIKQTPILGGIAKWIYFLARRTRQGPFPGTTAYWERRYSAGGDSGAGSYTIFAEFKAEVINEFVAAHDVQSVIEFGCGDGNQLSLAKYTRYAGYDVSSSAISRCRERFKLDQSKSFRLMSDYDGEKADLALSLDVLYHLVEDDVFDSYVRALFEASHRYVIIYSSDSDDNREYEGTHVRCRKFTRWIEDNLPNWKLEERLPNRYPYRGDTQKGSFSEFFIYQKT